MSDRVHLDNLLKKLALDASFQAIGISKFEDDNLVLLGETDRYVPLCRKCFLIKRNHK